MRILKTKPHLNDVELKKRLQQQNDVRRYQNWLIVYSVQTNPGKQAEEFAKILGVNIYKIYSVIECYNKEGKNWDGGKQIGGRREARAYLSLEEEKVLLEKIKQQACAGAIIIALDIKKEVEKEIGHPVSDDYIWDLFNRHKWKKKAPRPKHPKGDKQSQEEFKKNSMKIWLPPH